MKNTYACSEEEVVSWPVAGADVGRLVGDQVLVVVHPGKRDLRLLGAEGRHREQLHSAEQTKSWDREKQRRLPGSVADPDPNPDPYVFGPPGSGSINQRYGSGSGSGSFSLSKNRKKNGYRTVLWLLFDFFSLKSDVNGPSKNNKQENFFFN